LTCTIYILTPGFQLTMDDNYIYEELELYGYSEEEISEDFEIWDGFDD